ncbi:TonB-dependent receptor plug domain-containing protein [Alteraurantiacibacter buctensis]|uniref:TonB-dependent receptor n=1 Tax=Alteraurantiacibacter buctensis TaxID=1503981 RepID=A0A844Z135_9SPHN|nr:TonB-dependent receptor [Alteraurantiacibacter buctensis]MXO72966.1 TonB-dependent receptor [Alteraurantiacibacter buctensis]
MRKIALLCGVAAILTHGAAAAQDSAVPVPQSAGDAEDGGDTIVVTGSLIRGTSFQPSSPVDVLDREDFEEKGATSVARYLAELPYNTNAVTVPAGGGATAFTGGGTVNLRNLGDGATLILLNSRRQTRLPREANVVDVNGLVPQIMIGNVEILKDGASSLYGSDAVGGVVNMFTRDDFEGMELRAQTNIVTHSGKQESRFGGIFGGSLGDTHVVLAAEYNIRDQLFPEDQPWTDVPFYSSPWNPGRFVVPRRNAGGQLTTATTRVQDEGCGVTQQTVFFPAGTPNVTTGTCYYDFYPDSGLVSEENRVQTYAVVEHEFEPWLKLRLEGGYQRAHIEASTSTSASINVNPSIVVPGYNPGVARADADRIANGLAPVYFARNSAGQQLYAQPSAPGSMIPLRDANGVVVLAANPTDPASGIAFYEDVVFEGRILGSQCGLPTQNTLAPGECARSRTGAENINDALRFVGGFSGDFLGDWFYDTNFTYSKITERNNAQNNNVLIPQLRAALAGFGGPNCNAGTPGQRPGEGSCYFFNPFNNAIYATPGSAAANRQDVIDWLMPSLWDNYRTSQQVFDAYATGPLFDLPGGPLSLAFGMQYRRDTWAVDFDAAKNTGIVETGSVSTDVAAQQDALAFFAELSAPIFDNDLGTLNVNAAVRHEKFEDNSTTDPKIGVIYTVPSGWLTLRGTYGTSFLEPTLFQRFTQSSGLANISDVGPGPRGTDATRRITTLFEGNPNLEPQRSTSYSAGVILEPFTGFRFEAGYWHYTFDNLISAENTQALVTANDPAKVIRDGQNNVIFVKPSYINLAGLKTEGFDFEAQYSTDLGEGELNLSAIATYVPTYAIQSAPGRPFVNIAGNRNTTVTGGSLSPKWRGQGRMNYRTGPHSISTILNYYGGIENDALVRSPGDVKQPEDDYLSGTVTVDVTYTLDVGDFWEVDNSSISIGVRNLFQDRPELPSYDRGALLVDPRGRIAFLRVVAGF